MRARSAHGSDEDSPLMKGAKGAGSPPGSPEPKLPPGGRAARLLGGGRWKLALLAAGALLVLYPLLRGGSHAQDTSPENYVRVNGMQVGAGVGREGAGGRLGGGGAHGESRSVGNAQWSPSHREACRRQGTEWKGQPSKPHPSCTFTLGRH